MLEKQWIKVFFILWGILFGNMINAQNLVPNPGFEDYYMCPPGYSVYADQIFVSNWESPNSGTPDYFNSCAAQQCGVPRNYVGYAEAFEGNAYMGVIACMQQIDPKQIPVREYIQIKLTQPLILGEKYFASMQIRLGLSCAVSCNGMGMYLSNEPLQSNQKFNFKVQAQIPQIQAEAINDKNSWHILCGEYLAHGGEQYLTIGNFLANYDIDYIEFDENYLETNYASPMAFFYIDDVKVEPWVDSLNYACAAISAPVFAFSGSLSQGKHYILENLHFETDKSIIKPESFNELDRLVAILIENPKLNISIEGHTDNTGTKEHNLQLSENRAGAVWQYLRSKGIKPERISRKGFGDSFPLMPNTNEERRQKNRRVELVVKP